MKNKMVTGIGNFLLLNEYLQNLANQTDGPLLGLAQGVKGLGKTKTCLALTAHNPERFFYVRANHKWSDSWLCGAFLEELGLQPEYGLERRVKQLIEALRSRGKILFIIDEGDLVATQSNLLQTLRYIFDMTSVPIALIGLETTEYYVRKSGPYYDRLAGIFNFRELTTDDVALYLTEKAEIPFDDAAIRAVADSIEKRPRALDRFIMSIEYRARINTWKLIDVEKFRGFMKADKRNSQGANRGKQ